MNFNLIEREMALSTEDLPYVIYLSQSLSLPRFPPQSQKVLICKDIVARGRAGRGHMAVRRTRISCVSLKETWPHEDWN